MAIGALHRPVEIECATTPSFAGAVQQRLCKKFPAATVRPLGVGTVITTPLELLHLLGLATAASIPVRRHPAAAQWALARYIDIFDESTTHLALDGWVDRTEVYHRRAVLSEDLGIGMVALLARRTEPHAVLMDVDAWDGWARAGRVWSLSAQRPDYVTYSQSTRGRSALTAWEAKGRSDEATSSSVAATFERGARQTLGLRADGLATVVGRRVAGVVITRPVVRYHALAIEFPNPVSRRRRRQVSAFNPIEASIAFAGLMSSGAGATRDTRRSDEDQRFLGTRFEMQSTSGPVEIFMGVDAQVHQLVDRPMQRARSSFERRARSAEPQPLVVQDEDGERRLEVTTDVRVSGPRVRSVDPVSGTMIEVTNRS